MPNPIRIILCGIFVLLGLGLIAIGLRSIYFRLASKSWPTVIGRIMASEMGRHSDKHGTVYTADIQYDYTVNEKLYSGNLISFGHADTSNSDDARSDLNEYPVNKEVKIYYDPDNPHRSVLQPGVGNGGFVVILFGFGFMLIATLAYYSDRRSAKLRNNASPSNA